MTKDEAIETIKTAIAEVEWEYPMNYATAFDMAIEALKKQSKWIPVRERLPDNTDPVNITWVNHDPVSSYYADIKDKSFVATGHYCNGRWWWYSVTCQDYLDEYGHCDVDAMDDAIEVIAWMPLPYEKENE